MQESKFIDRTDINSPSFSKHVTICFNEQADSPLQLIAYDDEKGFIVNPEAEKFFESLKDDKLGVIAMVGKNRTGKSSLLNRVILNRTSGFSVGHTINPCTKGIWIWPHILEVEDKKNEGEKLKVLVMDTEGTGATDQKDNYDTQVFMLAMLLSSHFIYNSVGAIDEKAIQNLSLIVNLSKHLQKTNEKDFEDLVDSFPSFLWILRDFALKVVDARGNPMTSREYLETALKPQKGLSESIESKNRIRRFLTNFFKDRDCFMMVRPIIEEKEMQNLHNLDASQLRPEFNEQVSTLKRKIYSKVKPKMFKGKPINGPAFIVLCKMLCQTLNNGDVLSLESSWTVICKIECNRIIQELSDRYETETRSAMKDKNLTQPQIKQFHKEKRLEMLEVFRKRAMGDEVKEYEEQLNTILKQKYEIIKKSQCDEMREVLKGAIEEKLEDFKGRLGNKEYKSFIDLVTDLKNIKLDLEKDYNDDFSRDVLHEQMFQKLASSTEELVDDLITNLNQDSLVNKMKAETVETRLQSLKEELEAKQAEHTAALQNMDTERSKLKAQVTVMEQKLEAMEQEKNKQKQQLTTKMEEMAKEYQAKEEELNQKIESLKEKNQELENENQKLGANTEREIAMKAQQLEFTTQEVKNLTQSVANLQQELQDEKQLHTTSVTALEELRRSMTASSPVALKSHRLMRKAQEIREGSEQEEEPKTAARTERTKRRRGSPSPNAQDNSQSFLGRSAYRQENKDVETENMELRKSVRNLTNKIENNVEEFYKQKVHLEGMVTEIERYYRDKQSQDQLRILMLEKTVRTYENSDVAMVDINKKLAFSLERADLRAVQAEKKMEKLKKFKKQIKYAENLTCRLCQQTIKQCLFQDHINICLLGSGHQQQSKSLGNNSQVMRIIPDLRISIENALPTNMSSKCFKVEGMIDKKPFIINKSLADFKNLALSMKDEFKDGQASLVLTEFAQNALDCADDSKMYELGRTVPNTFASIIRESLIKESVTLQDFFGLNNNKRLEAPYCSVVCCDTIGDDQEEAANLLLTEEKDSSALSSQIKEMPSGIHHSRKASNRYLKEMADLDQPEDEEQYEKPSFNTLCKREHNMTDGDVMTHDLEGIPEQSEQVEQVELGEA